MNISAKQNYSYLFQGLGSSTGSTNLNFLSDYMSIKNGSYGKLLKAYYNPGHSKEVAALANNKVTKDTSEDTKKLAEVQSTTDKASVCNAPQWHRPPTPFSLRKI